jgi:hypothetical protein
MRQRIVEQLAASRRETMAATGAVLLVLSASGALALESIPVASGLSAALFVTASLRLACA